MAGEVEQLGDRMDRLYAEYQRLLKTGLNVGDRVLSHKTVLAALVDAERAAARREAAEEAIRLMRSAHPRQGPLDWQDGLDAVFDEAAEAIRAKLALPSPPAKEQNDA